MAGDRVHPEEGVGVAVTGHDDSSDFVGIAEAGGADGIHFGLSISDFGLKASGEAAVRREGF